jgi:hypothetical protein
MIEFEGVVCKGLFFRCITNAFFNNKEEYVEQVRFRPLKRLSCSGCPKCERIKEEIEESDLDTLMAYDTIKEGAVYQLDYDEISRDWETGIIDDWVLKFKLLDKKTTTGGDNESNN